MFEGVNTIVFDADDTLWENEPLFREAEREWAEVLKDYGTLEELSAKLYAVESRNMEDLGYGAKAFIISLLETAVEVTDGKLTGTQAKAMIDAGRKILHNPAEPLEGVQQTLEKLASLDKYTLVLLTKGDLLDQENKIERSGLGKYFDHVSIVSNKSHLEYKRLAESLNVRPQNIAMVGNSFKSDIKPVLELGGWGVYIPFRITWEHEKTEEFDHPHLVKIEKFSQLLDLFN